MITDRRVVAVAALAVLAFIAWSHGGAFTLSAVAVGLIAYALGGAILAACITARYALAARRLKRITRFHWDANAGIELDESGKVVAWRDKNGGLALTQSNTQSMPALVQGKRIIGGKVYSDAHPRVSATKAPGSKQ